MQSQPLLANIHALDGSICLARSIMPCQTTPSSSGRRFPLLTRTVASFMCSCYHLTERQARRARDNNGKDNTPCPQERRQVPEGCLACLERCIWKYDLDRLSKGWMHHYKLTFIESDYVCLCGFVYH